MKQPLQTYSYLPVTAVSFGHFVSYFPIELNTVQVLYILSLSFSEILTFNIMLIMCTSNVLQIRLHSLKHGGGIIK